MAKTKISEFSSTPANNTDIDSIFIGEGMAPSNVNDAIRELMAQLKDFQTGAVGDSFNGPIGSTTASTGAFTTLSATGNVTLGDASTDTLNVGNGGLIKDASGNLGLGVTPSAWSSTWRALDVDTRTAIISAGNKTSIFANNAVFESAGWKYKASQFAGSYAISTTTGNHEWSTAPSGTAGNAITFTQAMTLTADGNLGVGTTSPSGAAGTTIAVNGKSNQTRIALKNDSTGDAAGDGFQLGIDSSGLGCFIEQRENAEMRFSTNAVERARIDSSGRFMVGTTSAVTEAKLSAIASSSGQAAAFKSDASTSVTIVNLWGNEASGNQIFIRFATDSNQERGSISYNRGAGLVAYNVTSDYRAKDINGPVTNSGALIDSVPVYMGKMKGATQERPMFIAHETPAYAHTGEKDAVDADGNPVYQQMDASALIPVMWAEIQSLRKRLADAGIA